MQQLRALERGVDVVVATPGRALDHLRRGSLELDAVQTVILDEADEMLDMGFAEELEAILERTPAERQTALFSATLPKRILEIAKRHLHSTRSRQDPARKLAAGETARVREIAYIVQRRNKAGRARARARYGITESTIVFCRTRIEVDELTETLGSRGYSAEAIARWPLARTARPRAAPVPRRERSEFSSQPTSLPAASTSSTSRTYSISTCRLHPMRIVHRIGRTGRAGREGVAITLAEPREHRLLHNIELHTKRKIRVEMVPTVHDLRERRLELMKASLEEALESGGLERYRGVVEVLASEYDVLDLAAAAVKLVDQGRTDAQAEEVHIPAVPRAPARDGVAKLFVGVGRAAGIRPADLVGAIANEAGISSRSIGAIDIADRFSLVEVPASQIDDIIRKLRGSTIRGKKVNVRRDRETERKRC